MILKLKKKWLEHEQGDTIDAPEETGRLLIQQGIAEPVHAIKVIEKHQQQKPVTKVK